MFPDVSEEAARTQIEPFHDQFISAIKEAVRLFNTIEPPLLYRLVKHARVKANSLWGFIMHEIEETFRDASGIRVVPRKGSIEIEIGDNIVARIKKMKPSGFTSNYMTARVTEFHSADQGELFERMWARPLRVDIGYIEDATGTQIAEIMVARRDTPRHVDWKYPMTVAASVTTIPVATTTTETSKEATQVVGREVENEAQGTDDE